MPVKSERCWIFWFGLRPSHSEIQFRYHLLIGLLLGARNCGVRRASLSNTITLETKALTSRMCF